MARHRAESTAATKSQLDVLRWWQLMLKDLATSYPDIQLADSAGFSHLIDNEKINHQSMEAKSASLLMSIYMIYGEIIMSFISHNQPSSLNINFT